MVAEVLPSGGYRVLDEERENTRLAAALTKTGRLDPKAADATVNVLRNFLSIANGYGASQIRAIGTSALRDAEDGPEFCDRVRKELKLSIEVISAQRGSAAGVPERRPRVRYLGPRSGGGRHRRRQHRDRARVVRPRGPGV